MRKVYQAISQILGDILGIPPDVVTPDAATKHLTYQEKAAAAIGCEKTFHIELEDEKIDELAAVSDWVAYVKERMAERDEAYAPPTDADREAWAHQRKKG